MDVLPVCMIIIIIFTSVKRCGEPVEISGKEDFNSFNELFEWELGISHAF
jgi:hypothetical protein